MDDEARALRPAGECAPTPLRALDPARPRRCTRCARAPRDPPVAGRRRSERGETLSTYDNNGVTETDDAAETETEFAAHAVEIDHSTSGAPEVETVEELAARAPVTESNPLFSALGVRKETVEALESVGITRAFAIQELTLPIALGGAGAHHDVHRLAGCGVELSAVPEDLGRGEGHRDIAF